MSWFPLRYTTPASTRTTGSRARVPGEGQARADAWVEDRANGERGDPGARVRSEPPSWPLRARCRHRHAVPAGYRIRRTQTRHLNRPAAQVPHRHDLRPNNATDPHGPAES